MDIVITYVNSLDPEWLKSYKKATNTPILEKRFRDWGTLRYLFRGIEKNMPFIRKVHLVVAGESQIPEWINRKSVNIVYHSDIIPTEHLPTFNCNPIEMHLHRIKGLGRKYLYFNDDMFPMRPCKPSDFFRNGKALLGMGKHLFAWDMYKQICRNSDNAARRALNMKPSLCFLRPQHICSPMLKDVCEEVYEKVKDKIISSLTITRESNNLNQYLFLDYMYLRGELINRRLSKKHFSLRITPAERLCKFIKAPTRKFVCINDVEMSREKFEATKKRLIEAFEEVFPYKSHYEL